MKRKNWIVNNFSVRPAGKQDECFYCGEKVGSEHKQDCVIRSRTVVVDFTIRMVVDVPESWDKEDIEFKYNDGCWCADNLINLLDRENNGCLCPHVVAECIREATQEDEEYWGLVKVEDLES